MLSAKVAKIKLERSNVVVLLEMESSELGASGALVEKTSLSSIPQPGQHYLRFGKRASGCRSRADRMFALLPSSPERS